MNVLKQLDEWKDKHKARSCVVEHDDGYGSSCWIVTLGSEKGVVQVSHLDTDESIEPCLVGDYWRVPINADDPDANIVEDLINFALDKAGP